MHRLTESICSQQMTDNLDTLVSVRRSECTASAKGEIQRNHFRVSVDCLTFSNNPNFLHEKLVDLPNGTTLDLSEEIELKTDLDSLRDDLLLKGWVPGTQLITDYKDWLNSQILLK